MPPSRLRQWRRPHPTHLDQPIKPLAGQKEFGLFTSQFYNAGTGGLFSGNMEAAVLVSQDNLNWFTLTGQSITNPTTYTDTSYKLNAPSMGYNFQTLSQAWERRLAPAPPSLTFRPFPRCISLPPLLDDSTNGAASNDLIGSPPIS